MLKRQIFLQLFFPFNGKFGKYPNGFICNFYFYLVAWEKRKALSQDTIYEKIEVVNRIKS